MEGLRIWYRTHPSHCLAPIVLDPIGLEGGGPTSVSLRVCIFRGGLLDVKLHRLVAWYRRAASLMWHEGTDMPCATTPEYNNLALITTGRSLLSTLALRRGVVHPV